MISGAVRTLIASTGTTLAVLVTLLVVIGSAMIGVAIWLVRSTRTDPGALAPLEVMGERRFRKDDVDGRLAHLDTVRPLGAPSATAIVEPPEGTDPTPPETAAPPEPAAPPPENCESSMQESAVSAHTSDDGGADDTPDTGDAADADDGNSSE
jgi:hypothetical protein